MDNLNHEYEYKGLCLNGFAMLFITFILIPLLFALCIVFWSESNPRTCGSFDNPTLYTLYTGVCRVFRPEPNVARVMIFSANTRVPARKQAIIG